MLVLALGGGLVQAALGSGMLDRSGNVLGGDFLAFYTGGRFFEVERFDTLYDLDAQEAFQRDVAAPEELRGVHPFISPPHALAFYAPFALDDYLVSLSLWWLGGLAALVCAAALLRKELPALRRSSAPGLAAGCFCFFPTVAWLLYGQATAWILLIYAAAFVALRRGRDFTGGACIGALAFKPQLALGLAFVLLCKGRWSAVAGGLVTCAASLALGWFISPEATLEYWTAAHELFALLRSDGYQSWGLHSAFGFAVLLLDGFSPLAADLLALALSLGLLALLATVWRGCAWEPGARRWDLHMAATFSLGLILSPHLFLYDLMLLLVPFAIVFHHYSNTCPGRALDGGSLLLWSAAVWLLSFLAKPLCLGTLTLTAWAGAPAFALQLTTFAIGAWALVCVREARAGLPAGATR